MIILGIDPGTAIVGFGVIKYENNLYETLTSGVIKTDPHQPDAERLEIIYLAIKKIIKKYHPNIVSVESLFYFKNQKTVMTVSQARGVILLAIQEEKIPIKEFTPLQVKQALTTYGRAEKEQLQKMVKLILNLDETPKPDDAADALACAITCSQLSKFEGGNPTS